MILFSCFLLWRRPPSSHCTPSSPEACPGCTTLYSAAIKGSILLTWGAPHSILSLWRSNPSICTYIIVFVLLTEEVSLPLVQFLWNWARLTYHRRFGSRRGHKRGDYSQIMIPTFDYSKHCFKIVTFYQSHLSIDINYGRRDVGFMKLKPQSIWVLSATRSLPQYFLNLKEFQRKKKVSGKIIRSVQSLCVNFRGRHQSAWKWISLSISEVRWGQRDLTFRLWLKGHLAHFCNETDTGQRG